MLDNGEHESIDEIFHRLNAKADILYRLVMWLSDYMSKANDYGTGQLMNMVEIHTLTAIEENPGITVTEISKTWNKTKGAVSQTVTKLASKGFVSKVKLPENAKTVLLFPTESGKTLSKAHKTSDAIDLTKGMEYLLKKHTMEEIDVFYRVANTYLEMFKLYYND